MRGWLRKLCTAVQLFVFGTATVALFVISLVGSPWGGGGGWRDSTELLPPCLQVPYSYIEPSSHGHLWTGAHRLFGAVEHLQLANSYGLFRRMTGLGGRPEVVLEGSYDGHHWTVDVPAGRAGKGGGVPPVQRVVLTCSAGQEIEFMYKPGNVSRPPPVVVPHQPRLDWQMWFAALGPHSHSPWFTSLVLRLLQGKDPGEARWGVGGGWLVGKWEGLGERGVWAGEAGAEGHWPC